MTSVQIPKPPSALLVVFIADDSAVVRFAVTRQLRAAGFDVVEQASAAPPSPGLAIRAACALLDLDLGDPTGDGCDLAAALRAERPDLPVAFFSAAAAPDCLARALAIGPVFAKPDALAAAIAWVIANAKP